MVKLLEEDVNSFHPSYVLLLCAEAKGKTGIQPESGLFTVFSRIFSIAIALRLLSCADLRREGNVVFTWRQIQVIKPVLFLGRVVFLAPELETIQSWECS